MKKYLKNPKNLLTVLAVLFVLGLGTYMYVRKQKEKEEFRDRILDSIS